LLGLNRVVPRNRFKLLVVAKFIGRQFVIVAIALTGLLKAVTTATGSVDFFDAILERKSDPGRPVDACPLQTVSIRRVRNFKHV